MKTSAFFVAISIAASTLAGCTIKRSGEFECGLPDGGSFVRRSEYDWDPLANIIPSKTALAERLNQTGFETYYKDRKSKAEIRGLGSISQSINYQEIDTAKKLCLVFGVINQTPYHVALGYKKKNDDKFSSIEVEGDLFFDPRYSAELDKNLRDELGYFDVAYGGTAIIWHPEKLVLESGIVKKDSNPSLTVAVYRIESFDGGQTWVNPHITTKPEAFELGKTFDEQCFIARLIRIDNKKIEAHFPPCPVAHKLPD